MNKESDSQLMTRFDDIYNLPDCRAYYKAMHESQYSNADYAIKGFVPALNELQRIRGLEKPLVMDFASGYGIGALLMRHYITLEQVLDRYQAPKFMDATVENVIKWDQQWIDQNKHVHEPCSIFGIDVADQALQYGQAVGIFDSVFALDLQKEQPGEELSELIHNCDMIIEVGSVIHLLPGALDTILGLCGEILPWIVSSPIRGNESEESMKIMESAGLVVEAMPIPPFPHRMFMDEAEKERATKLVEERGFDTEGFESTGSYHAQLYIARPENECTPLENWLDI